jgi:hypothetical protein
MGKYVQVRSFGRTDIVSNLKLKGIYTGHWMLYHSSHPTKDFFTSMFITPQFHDIFM